MLADMIRVHHLNLSRSIRALWLLEELELPYEIVSYKRKPSFLAPDELKKVHPLGKSPVVEVEGHVLAESGAILEYFADRHGGESLVPQRDSEAYLRYRYFLHYAEGSLMPPLVLKLVLSKLGPLGWPAFPYANGEINKHLDYLEGELATRDYFAGDAFSAADIQMTFPLVAASSRAGLDSSRPRLMKFIERMEKRPALGRARARGGHEARRG